ncbi:competence type IV pilus minor pilin ComGD [Bacillus alkalicellulosilyticus]|uniref:competence type IV pilus minor pilin ComGD n=1 Tax=Alkalihalobacterium alkalicellulosilyticum TaxID=1912214 RepID=UPI000996ACBE|nr:competence type IV pilus minor pilin ComGD [Bacillus alkalicellulosilyticus]
MEKLLLNQSKEQGYSLPELIITLSILSILTGLVMVSFQPLQAAHKKQHFLTQFQNEVYFAQQLAISTGISTSVLISNTQGTYAVSQYNTSLYRRTFDNQSIFFQRGSIGIHDIMYQYNGNISKSGTLLVEVDNEKYRIVFLLGKGRFYIEKL